VAINVAGGEHGVSAIILSAINFILIGRNPPSYVCVVLSVFLFCVFIFFSFFSFFYCVPCVRFIINIYWRYREPGFYMGLCTPPPAWAHPTELSLYAFIEENPK